MDGTLLLAELKGYVTAKVNDYRSKNQKEYVPAGKVAEEFDILLDIIIDMQGQKEHKEQEKIKHFIDTNLLSTIRNIRDLKGE